MFKNTSEYKYTHTYKRIYVLITKKKGSHKLMVINFAINTNTFIQGIRHTYIHRYKSLKSLHLYRKAVVLWVLYGLSYTIDNFFFCICCYFFIINQSVN